MARRPDVRGTLLGADVPARDPHRCLVRAILDDAGDASDLDAAERGSRDSATRIDARGSRRRCRAFTSSSPTQTLNPPSRHSCQTGERSTDPSSRRVASTATNGSSRKPSRSSMLRFVRMPQAYPCAAGQNRRTSSVTGRPKNLPAVRQRPPPSSYHWLSASDRGAPRPEPPPLDRASPMPTDPSVQEQHATRERSITPRGACLLSAPGSPKNRDSV